MSMVHALPGWAKFFLLLVTRGSFTRKSNFASSLQVYNANNKFLFSKMNQLNVKSHPENRHVNKPKWKEFTLRKIIQLCQLLS
jgi:hypothetical protein